MTIRSAQSQKRKLEEQFARNLEEGLVADPSMREIYEQDLAHRRVACRVRPADLGNVWRLSGEGMLGLGAPLMKSRVARGISLKELGERMYEEDPVATQQVGRYEDEDWWRAGLWQLRQAADAPGLRVRVEVDLEADLEPLGEGPEADAQ